MSQLVDALRRLLELAAAFVAGFYKAKSVDRAERAEAELQSIHDADEAVAAARGWSTADRLRFLEQRGRVRHLS